MDISRVFRTVSGIVLGLATCVGMSDQTAPATKGEAMHISIQEVHVQRVNIVTTEPFDTVVARIDAQIGHPDMAAFRQSLSAAQNEAEMEKVGNRVTQPNGLMEFTRFDHGEVLQKENGTAKPRILRIVAGNPLIMKERVKYVVGVCSDPPGTFPLDR